MFSTLLLVVCAAAAILPNGVNAAGHGSSIVRLADEPSDDFSRLEIFINDMWVAVCDEGMMFMEAAADSVCQELDGVGAESSNYTHGVDNNGTEAVRLVDLIMCNDNSSFIDAVAGCTLNTTLCTNYTIRLSCICSQFECSDGHCGIACDGREDCSDEDDEDGIMCGRCTLRCNNGDCVNGTMCDGTTDCMDESDEDDIMCGRCTLRCNNGDCVNGTMCDGTTDCMDESDEKSLSCDCTDSMIRCDDLTCVDGELCDGTEDCEDGSDEDNLVCDIATGLSDAIRIIIGIFSALGAVAIATPIAIILAICACTGACIKGAAKSSVKVSPMKKVPTSLPKPV